MTNQPWLTNYPNDIKWDKPIDPKPVYHLLDEAAAHFPETVAIDFLGYHLTYNELHTQVNQCSLGLRKLGLTKGTRVGLLLPNCPQFIIAYYAILRAGGVAVNFNPLYAEDEIKHQLNDSGCEMMVTLNMKLTYDKLCAAMQGSSCKKIIVAELKNYLPFPKNILFPIVKSKEIAKVRYNNDVLSFQSLMHLPDEMEPVECNPKEDLALLQYTGGTTGVPKGAMLTHQAVYSNAVQCATWTGASLENGKFSILGCLPMFHVFGMTAIMNLGISKAATLIIHPKFTLKDVLKDVHLKQPKMLPGVPTMFNAILNYPKVKKYRLTSLEACVSGGAGLPVEIKQKFEEMTGAKLIEGYGLTEASPVTHCNALEGEPIEGSIGLPLPMTEVKIMSTEESGKEMPLGERGELCVNGPQIMKGYWQRESDSKDVLKDGWLHTGDIGYIDEQGYTYIVDRQKELILSGGNNVYPRHVEEAIYQNDAVLECAVIGVLDDHFGQKVVACIVVKPGKTLNDAVLRDFLSKRLARFEQPREIFYREELPKSMIGKILKKELLEELKNEGIIKS